MINGTSMGFPSGTTSTVNPGTIAPSEFFAVNVFGRGTFRTFEQSTIRFFFSHRLLLNIDPVDQTAAYRFGDFKLIYSDGKMDGWFSTPDAANHSRTVQCKRSAPSTVCAGVERPCLFNIAVDPCEQDDLFSDHPDMIRVSLR